MSRWVQPAASLPLSQKWYYPSAACEQEHFLLGEKEDGDKMQLSFAVQVTHAVRVHV